MAMFSTNEIVTERLNEIVNEVFDADRRISEMQLEIERLEYYKLKRMAEHELLSKIENGAIILSGDSNKKQDKMMFEDCLVSISIKFGRPMKFSEIRNALEQFGFKYTYANAYNRITNSGLVQNAARGYYNILSNRGW